MVIRACDGYCLFQIVGLIRDDSMSCDLGNQKNKNKNARIVSMFESTMFRSVSMSWNSIMFEQVAPLLSIHDNSDTLLSQLFHDLLHDILVQASILVSGI